MEKRKGKKGGVGGVLRHPPRVDLGDKRTKPDIYTPQTRMVEGKWADKRGGQKADKREKRGVKKRTKEGQNVIKMTKNERGSLTWGTKDISCVFYVCGI